MATKIEINNEHRDKLVEIFQSTKVEHYNHNTSEEFALFTKILKLKAIRENYKIEDYIKILEYFKENGLSLRLKKGEDSIGKSSLYAFLSHAFQHPDLAIDPNNTINLSEKRKFNNSITPQTTEDTENTFKDLKEQFMKDIEYCSENKITFDSYEDLDLNNNKIGCDKCISGYIQNEKGQWVFCDCYLKELLITKFRNSGIKNEYININHINEDLIDFVAKKSFSNDKSSFKGEKINNFIQNYINNIDELLTEGWNLIIEGPTGSCKTTSACILAKNAIKNGYTSLFIEMQQLRKIWVTEKLSEELEKAKNKLLTVDLLIIDDFGQEFMSSNSDYQLSELDNLLRERISLQKSVIITTNATPENLKKRYGDRIYSLLNYKMIHLYIKTKEDLRKSTDIPSFL